MIYHDVVAGEIARAWRAANEAQVFDATEFPMTGYDQGLMLAGDVQQFWNHVEEEIARARRGDA